MEDWESDNIVEQWIRENDDTFMSLPTIECNPHLLISKVSFLFCNLFFCVHPTSFYNKCYFLGS